MVRKNAQPSSNKCCEKQESLPEWLAVWLKILVAVSHLQAGRDGQSLHQNRPVQIDIVGKGKMREGPKEEREREGEMEREEREEGEGERGERGGKRRWQRRKRIGLWLSLCCLCSFLRRRLVIVSKSNKDSRNYVHWLNKEVHIPRQQQ